MIDLVNTMKQSGKICVKCKIAFYEMRKTFDFYDNPGAEVGEIQTLEQEEKNLSHEAEDSRASNGAIEILNGSLQATEESPLKQNSCKKRSILRRDSENHQHSMIKMVHMSANKSEEVVPSTTESEFVAQLKDKFKTNTKRNERVYCIKSLDYQIPSLEKPKNL
jgi:hypothetical protein